MILTIEQFLEKFPYKVGDKVFVKTAGESIVITNMYWCNVSGQVIYGGESNTREYDNICVSQIQPYAEQETMEETKKDLDWHPTDYLEFVDNDEWADEVELNLGNSYKIQIRCGKTYAVKKKPQYPKTYAECCKVVNASPYVNLVYNIFDGQTYSYDADNLHLYEMIRRLKICRDAYWKIAGDWIFDFNEECYQIGNECGEVYRFNKITGRNGILSFPTEEMRDTFYENFKDLIEECKELL